MPTRKRTRIRSKEVAEGDRRDRNRLHPINIEQFDRTIDDAGFTQKVLYDGAPDVRSPPCETEGKFNYYYRGKRAFPEIMLRATVSLLNNHPRSLLSKGRQPLKWDWATTCRALHQHDLSNPYGVGANDQPTDLPATAPGTDGSGSTLDISAPWDRLTFPFEMHDALNEDIDPLDFVSEVAFAVQETLYYFEDLLKRGGIRFVRPSEQLRLPIVVDGGHESGEEDPENGEEEPENGEEEPENGEDPESGEEESERFHTYFRALAKTRKEGRLRRQILPVPTHPAARAIYSALGVYPSDIVHLLYRTTYFAFCAWRAGRIPDLRLRDRVFELLHLRDQVLEDYGDDQGIARDFVDDDLFVSFVRAIEPEAERGDYLRDDDTWDATWTLSWPRILDPFRPR